MGGAQGVEGLVEVAQDHRHREAAAPAREHLAHQAPGLVGHHQEGVGHVGIEVEDLHNPRVPQGRLGGDRRLQAPGHLAPLEEGEVGEEILNLLDRHLGAEGGVAPAVDGAEAPEEPTASYFTPAGVVHRGAPAGAGVDGGGLGLLVDPGGLRLLDAVGEVVGGLRG